MALGSNTENYMSEINVTPFVDVMLVLLIIFMVTAPMMTEGVDVALPEATTEPLPSTGEELIVTIDREGGLFIGKMQISHDNLPAKLKNLLEGRVDQAVYLRADKQIPYGVVVRVMSGIREAGVENIGMITVPYSSQE